MPGVAARPVPHGRGAWSLAALGSLHVGKVGEAGPWEGAVRALGHRQALRGLGPTGVRSSVSLDGRAVTSASLDGRAVIWGGRGANPARSACQARDEPSGGDNVGWVSEWAPAGAGCSPLLPSPDVVSAWYGLGVPLTPKNSDCALDSS